MRADDTSRQDKDAEELGSDRSAAGPYPGTLSAESVPGVIIECWECAGGDTYHDYTGIKETPCLDYTIPLTVAGALGFLVASAPLAVNVNIPTCAGTDPISLVLNKVAVELGVHLEALLACTTLVDAKGTVEIIVALLRICADDLLKIGAGVVIEAEAKGSIVACCAAMITLLVQICVHLSVKLGLAAIINICAELDVVLRLLLVNLNICIDGIVVLIAKQLALALELLVQLHFKLCLSVLGL